MKIDFIQFMARRTYTQRLLRKPLSISPALLHFVQQNAPVSFAAEAIKTSQYHCICKQSGIDDGRRYFEYFLEGELVGICGYQQRKCDPPSVVWGGFSICCTQLSPLIKMQIKFDTIQHIMEHTVAQQFYVETFADRVQSNMLSILEKLNAQKVGELKGFYGPGEDMHIMQLNLQDIRAAYLSMPQSNQ